MTSHEVELKGLLILFKGAPMKSAQQETCRVVCVFYVGLYAF